MRWSGVRPLATAVGVAGGFPLIVFGLATLALAATTACANLGTDPAAAVAISFDSTALPYPAVVAGDTLRDSTGQVTRLRATALNYRNEALADAPIEFFSPDTLARVDRDGLVIGRVASSSASARVFADVGTLQSQPVQLVVTDRPDSVAAVGAAADTVTLRIPDVAGANVFGPFQVRVLHRVPGQDPTGVRAWRVHFTLTYRGQLLAPTDTAAAYLLSNTRRPSPDAVTDATGQAGVSVRVRPLGLAAAKDSIIVSAEVTARGRPLPGSPVRFVLHFQPPA